MITFRNLEFQVEDGRIFLTKFGNLCGLKSIFAEVQVCGEHKDTHMGVKMAGSSEGIRLRYVSSKETENALEILQETPVTQIKTVFTAYDDTNTIRVSSTVTNRTAEPIVLEEAAAFTVTGFGGKEAVARADRYYFTRFVQSHHAECQPLRQSFEQMGLGKEFVQAQKRLAFCNVGSWSTKESLPQAILENTEDGSFLMFQIESAASWYYEISDRDGEYYLYLGGPNLSFGGWSAELQPGESYTTPYAALSFGESLNRAIGEMTRYRRHIAGQCPGDAALPTIFNEYMHLSWNDPTEENTARYAPIAAKTGVEYYVIDCGWHDEEPGEVVFNYVGKWQESKCRFPSGVKKTLDAIRALGMKPGLWIEPEVIGMECKEMAEYYGTEGLLQRNGKPVNVWFRYFLDYRNEKVREYMTETVRRMVEDYGAAYIKMDYNQDCGVGTDYQATAPGQGLEECTKAFFAWLQSMMERFPDVVFEGCASGGMRMDYQALSVFSLVSTSDQTNYLKYPYIAGNILCAVLPEQAAVWSYPVGSDCKSGEEVSDARIAMNMINSFLGRMHLASHLDWLSDRQLAIVTEGVAYYNTLSEMKKRAVPYFPNGFTKFGDNDVCAGLRDGDRIYLGVWCLGDNTTVSVSIEEAIESVKIAYPSASDAAVSCTEAGLQVQFPQSQSAVFLEIGLKS